MRILFITATRIGDAVISTGLLNHVVKQHPQARITVACGPLAASLFADVPGLDQVIVVKKRTFSRHWVDLWCTVRKHDWDLVIDLRRSLVSYFLSASQRLRLGPDDDISHRVVLLSGLLDLNQAPAPKVWLGPDHVAAAQTFLKGHERVVAICPVAARPEKTWPIDRFIALSQALLESKHANHSLLFVGSDEDRPVIEEIQSRLPRGKVLSLIGEADLLLVGAALSQAALTIANDSGLAHLAAALNCPTIALFGPTRDDLYRPWGQHVRVVCAPGSIETRPISAISVDAVMEEVNAVLA